MLLYTTLGLSALVIAVIVYRYDLYEREPWWMILLAIAAGAGAMYASGIVQVYFYSLLGPASTSNPITVSVMAGLNEELAKFLVVLAIVVLLPRQFNDPTDGLIYGAMAGLGAAIEESTVFLRREPAASLPAAELIRLAGHLIMGGIGAAGLGLALSAPRLPRHTTPPPSPSHPAIRSSPSRFPPSVPSCLRASVPLLAAILLHTAWDLIAVPANDSGQMTGLRTIFSIALMLAGLAAFAALTLAAQSRSRALFAPSDPLSPARRLRQGREARP